MPEENKVELIKEEIEDATIMQETCECGNRSFFILCWHESKRVVNVPHPIESWTHNWIIVCSKCGKVMENDDLFFSLHGEHNE